MPMIANAICHRHVHQFRDNVTDVRMFTMRHYNATSPAGTTIPPTNRRHARQRFTRGRRVRDIPATQRGLRATRSV